MFYSVVVMIKVWKKFSWSTANLRPRLSKEIHLIYCLNFSKSINFCISKEKVQTATKIQFNFYFKIPSNFLVQLLKISRKLGILNRSDKEYTGGYLKKWKNSAINDMCMNHCTISSKSKIKASLLYKVEASSKIH